MKLFIILYLLVLGIYAESDHDRIIRLETQVENLSKTIDEHEGYISADMRHKRENYKHRETGDMKDLITMVVQGIMVLGGGGYLVNQRRRNGNGKS